VKNFFVPGRVFQIVYSEPTGKGALEAPGNPQNRNYSDTTLGSSVFSTTRRFVIIRVFPKFCWSLPIYTYRYQGLAVNKLNDEECQAHAVIYSSNLQPDEDDRTNKPPIAVNPATFKYTLHQKSRLHLQKIMSIERNLPVKDFGIVRSNDLKWLQEYLIQLCLIPQT